MSKMRYKNLVCYIGKMNWKKGLILEAIDRASIMCLTEEALISEVEKLKLIFWKHGHSESFFKSFRLF